MIQKEKRIKILFTAIIVFICAGLVTFMPVHAADCIGNQCPTTFLDIGSFFIKIINIFEVMAGIVFFFMLVLAGYLFITGTGDTKKLDAAKKSLFFSMIGFAAVFIPFIIFPLLGRITNVNNGLSFNSGGSNFSSHLGSTYTATPLPSFLQNTTTPLPSPTPAESVAQAFQNIVPKPVSAKAATGAFTITQDTIVYYNPSSNGVFSIAEYLTGKIDQASGFTISPVASSSSPSGNTMYLTLDGDSSLGDEGYILTVSGNGVVLEANKEAGLFRGAETILQILPAAIESQKVSTGTWQMQNGVITDNPRFGWRGIMLDVARHFFSVNDVKKLIDEAAYYKINVFHLHLTDDQGWRIQIKSHCDLTGSSSNCSGITDTSTDCQTFYTQACYKEIVAYAQARYITVIPEIDMPGHMKAAISAEPQLANGCGGICVHSAYTKQFVKDVLAEVAAMNKAAATTTTENIIDVGGDESSLPLSDYNYFLGTVVKPVITSLGVQMEGWNQIGTASLPASTISQYWIGANALADAVSQGASVVMSPADRAYLDMKYAPGEPPGIGNTWDGYTNVCDAYNWDPSNGAQALTGKSNVQVLGDEGPVWTETLSTLSQVQEMAFPRLLDLAEIGWSSTSGRSWGEYVKRLGAQLSRLTAMDVNFYPTITPGCSK